MKDLFSDQPAAYAQFRPTYPPALIADIAALLPQHFAAWDCATGNGQVAELLKPHFKQVYATDISEAQMAVSHHQKEIFFSVQPAEHTDFPNDYFDLVTVAQAIHWFDFELFYKEVRRVLNPNGIIAVIGYNLLRIDDMVDHIISHLHFDTLDNYWSPERQYVDEGYKTIPFPFTEINLPKHEMMFEWTFAQLMGYLNTWSAVKTYIKKEGRNPLDEIEVSLKTAWGDTEIRHVHFPLLLRVGRV